MNNQNQTRLVATENTPFERVASVVVGIGFVALVLSLTTLMRVTTAKTDVVGIGLFTLLGVALTVSGVLVLALGAASRAGLADTAPDRNAGLITGGAFALIGFVTGSLVASQTFGIGGPRLIALSSLGWAAVGLVTAVVAAAVTILPREDVGSTVLPGVLTTAIGLVFVTGLIDPSWVWKTESLSGEVAAAVAVPVLTIFGALLTAWAAAKARGGFGSRGREDGAFMLIGLNAFGMIALLVILLAYVASKGFAPATEGFQLFPFKWPFVTNGHTFRPEVPDGVAPAIVGTVWLVIGAVLFAVPLGVGAAVFLTEYAEQGRFTQVVEIATNGLWSTPSIVFGLFGYAFLVPRLGNNTSILAGMFVLGFMLLPLVMITSREALKSVPDEYRDASAALGVSQWQTVRSVVLPAAMPGVITGIILGVGRIAGETAPILLVTAGGLRAGAPKILEGFRFTASPPFVANPALLQSSQALPYKLYAIITAGVSGKQEFGWATAFILLVVVLSFYAIGIASRKYFQRKLSQ